MKQAIIIRTDLDMGKGKIAAQSSHASLASYLKSDSYSRKAWILHGMKKIVVKVTGEKELVKMFAKAKAMKLPCAIISDAGHTQIESGSKTAVGIGPASDEAIDKITGGLKLL